jgi:hypothetical protein
MRMILDLILQIHYLKKVIFLILHYSKFFHLQGSFIIIIILLLLLYVDTHSLCSTVYAISALSPFEPKGRKPKGLTNEKLLYLQLNGPFFQAIERMKSDLTGNHSIVPRFYIAKNRTLLRQIRSQGVLAIFYNTKINRTRSSKVIRIETDMILAYPASDMFDIDQINECTDDFAPKAWIHLRPLREVNKITFEVNETIERDYFRRMFATSKMATDDKSNHHNSSTKNMLKKIVRQILGLPDEASVSQPSAPPPIQRPLTKEEEAMEVDEGSDDEMNVEESPKVEPVKSEEVKKEPDVVSNTQFLGTREISHDVWKKLFSGKKKRETDVIIYIYR